MGFELAIKGSRSLFNCLDSFLCRKATVNFVGKLASHKFNVDGGHVRSNVNCRRCQEKVQEHTREHVDWKYLGHVYVEES